MTTWANAFCTTNKIDIHYTRTGTPTMTATDKPPLLLLHGLTANGACWTEIAESLETEYDVIMPDLRGHGKSSVPDYGYSYDDHAADASGLIGDLGISAPVVVGHSMGGLTAAVLADRFPSCVRGLVLADPTFLDSKQQRRGRDSGVDARHRKLLATSPEDVAIDLRKRHPHRSSSIIDFLAKARFEASMAAFDVLTPPSPDYRDLMASLAVPILLVIAGQGVVSEELALELQAANPKIQIARIADAGHGLIYDQPKQFAGLVRTFLRSFENTAVI